MKDKKECKILFNYLFKHLYKRALEDTDANEDGEINKEEPFFEVENLIKYILKQAKKNRFYDLKDAKFCFISTANIESDANNKIIVIDGYFTSARSEFRPNIIDKKTGEERKNPKTLNEGDIEKTHFIIKIDKNTQLVHFVLEYNHHGVNSNNVESYLKHFNLKYLKNKGEKRSYSIKHAIVPKPDFRTELANLETAKVAEIHFDKKLLGSNALDFSNRYIHVKNDVKLVIQSKPLENIKETAVDLFNVMNGGNRNIEKIRIYGKNFDNNDVVLDTSFMSKTEFIIADLNMDTGEVMTPQILTGLKKIASRL